MTPEERDESVPAPCWTCFMRSDFATVIWPHLEQPAYLFLTEGMGNDSVQDEGI
jgi:hypothetical protein